jgi:hypothetical protein
MAEGTGTKAVKLVGEAVVPGVSLMLDGEIKSGSLHLLGGAAGRLLLGPIGWFYAAADSYSRSTTGKHFHQHFLTSSK